MSTTAVSPSQYLSLETTGVCARISCLRRRDVRLPGCTRYVAIRRLSGTNLCRRSIALRSKAENEEETVTPAITLSEKALNHLTKMRSELNKDLLLRLGVRQGGCSGYSYVMDFEDRSKIAEGDSIIEHDGFAMVCDPKSLLFLYGMQLDFSDALIGGGFSFQNPNASSSCGCGKSFAA